MKRSLTILLFLVLSLQFISCSLFEEDDPSPQFRKPSEMTTSELDAVNSSVDFSLDLYRTIAQETALDENLFISPLSAYFALVLAWNGAYGETLDEMSELLGFEGMEYEEANEICRDLIDILTNVDPAVTVDIANSVWGHDSFTFTEDYLARCEEYLYAEARNLNFKDPTSQDIINDWVSDATNGKILEMVGPELESYVAFLVNAVYFNGGWRIEFDEDLTKAGIFTNFDGEVTTDFMGNSHEYDVWSTDTFDAVELPYGDETLTMTVIQPKTEADFIQMEQSLNSENWDSWINRTQSYTALVSMPKFKFSAKIGMNDALIALGMEEAFDEDMADFREMNGVGGIFVSTVYQKSFVDVSEKGTEAAAATGIGMGPTSGPMYLFINKPFLFFIREEVTGAILFAGRMVDPTDSGE